MDMKYLPEGLRIYEINSGRSGPIQRDNSESIRIIAPHASDALRDYLESFFFEEESEPNGVYDILDLMVSEGSRFGIVIADVTDDYDYIPMTRSALEKIVELGRGQSSKDDEEGSE